MRWFILNLFQEHVIPLQNADWSIGVVGGYDEEPELRFLNSRDITFYGIQRNANFNLVEFDLNKIQDAAPLHDLVLCSQVLEHVYDAKQALINLASLVKVGGYLWVACPASNYAHGSPEYFSAGYTPQLITKLLEPLGFETLYAEKWGSDRMYFFTHALRYWPTEQEYRNPLRFAVSRYLLIHLFWRLCALFKSRAFTNNLHSATETVVFARKVSVY